MDEKPELKTESNRNAKKEEGLLDWLECIVSGLIVCVLIFTFLCRPAGVIGSSMVPTLEDGDRLLISRLFFEPEYGDIVVLRKESFKTEPIIKRIIATEGQTVDIDFERGIVYVDGIALEEPYINELTHDAESFTGPVTVPEGCVFVMGDNRNRSTDSRYASIGCVDTRLILGKAFFRLSPLNKLGGLY